MACPKQSRQPVALTDPAMFFNPLTPNDHYTGHTAPLTSKRCILYIYSTNIGTEYFKHSIYSQFFSLQNAVCFILLMYLVPVLFTFYIQCVLKLKKNNSGTKRLSLHSALPPMTCRNCALHVGMMGHNIKTSG